MKVLLILLALTSPVAAGYTCTQVGDTTYCTGDNGGSVTCTRVGDMTYCS